MPRKMMINSGPESFGDRLARIRKAAGFSQRDLANEIGISNRMVAYYEKQTVYPPAHLLPLLAKVLSVSTDALLGLEDAKVKRSTKDNRLWRRFQKIEQLGSREKRQIIQFLDTFIEREQLKQRIE